MVNTMSNKIFLYDEALTDEIRETINIVPIVTEIIAELSGKLYKTNSVVVMNNQNLVCKARGHSRTLGAICEFNEDDMPKILDRIDTYKCCSMSRIGVSHPQDFTYRTILPVYPICFDSIHDLSYYKYNYLEPIECWVYLMNLNNVTMQKALKDGHKKISSGIDKVGFTSLLKRKNLI